MNKALRIAATGYRWLRPLLLAASGTLATAVSVLLVAVFAFPYDADQLAPEAGGPLVITDRHGTVLRSVPAADGRPGRTDWVSLDEIPSDVLLTVIASEDDGFYDHGGVDGAGIVRAAWLNARERRLGYGGSTITMQLARMVHSPGQKRGIGNKLKEAVLAMRMERALSKREILEQYLNRAYYGNGAYGIEAAARTYFGKPARSLSAGQATLLAVLPRAPTAYDPLVHLPAAIGRRDRVLALLQRRGLLAADQVRRVIAEPITPTLHRPPNRAPHFTDWVLAQLPADVRARGGVVRTSLDLPLQQQIERRLIDHVDGLAQRNLGHAGAVVLDTESGQVLAMVGSAGWEREGGQINITTRRRHPGSALKPFVYALAIEGGDNPASIAYDVLDVPSDYKVIQLTQREHGPVRYREALAGSYNLAAVHTLEKVGVPDLMSTLRRAGIGPLDGTPQDYGLRLALGSAKIRLLDLAAGYRFLVADGKVRAPTGVIETAAPDGTVTRTAPTPERQLFSEATSWMVMDMLADPEARRTAFGYELPLDLPFDVAAKTGTSRGFADTVAVAATREIIVAAWAGNFDGEPTQGLVAMQAAAPIVRDALLTYADGHALTLPQAPRSVTGVAVCPVSGMRAGPHCPHQIREHVHASQPPTRSCDWHRADGLHYPPELGSWADRLRRRGGRLASW